MEEYMESELSGIFRVKLVTKNIVHGSPGTQFMHMRVKVFYFDFIFIYLYPQINHIQKRLIIVICIKVTIEFLVLI